MGKKGKNEINGEKKGKNETNGKKGGNQIKCQNNAKMVEKRNKWEKKRGQVK